MATPNTVLEEPQHRKYLTMVTQRTTVRSLLLYGTVHRSPFLLSPSILQLHFAASLSIRATVLPVELFQTTWNSVSLVEGHGSFLYIVANCYSDKF